MTGISRGQGMGEISRQITGTTRVFGVIADPISHVRAPMVFNPLFEERGLDHVLVPVHATAENLGQTVRALATTPNFGGLAVTIPHKVALAALCDTLGRSAEVTGAVNVVRFEPDGTIHGENFDGTGFVEGLRRAGHQTRGMRVLMLGAGGAARAIGHSLIEAEAASITIHNRTRQRADELAQLLLAAHPGAKIEAVDKKAVKGCDMVVNTTSLGIHADDDLPITPESLDADTLVADIVMVPERTKWLARAEKAGLETHYGRHMLDCQVEFIGRFMGAL